ncbi:MAG: zinc ribbon domain-containing protein [Bacilli bacterium]|nr:zinc ribbon domain-containing protein [Bacilli bacterium]
MYCKNCGKNIENDSSFCKNCGNAVEKIKKNYAGLIIIGIIIIILNFIGAIGLGRKIAYYINSTENIPTYNDSYFNDNFYHQDDWDDYLDDNHSYDNYNKEDIDNFDSIDIEEFLELKKENIPSIIILGESKNITCYQQLLYFYRIGKIYNIKINYLDLTDFDTEDYEKLKASDEMFSSPWNIPLTLIVQNDKIIDKKEGLQTNNDLLEFFKKNGIITEK